MDMLQRISLLMLMCMGTCFAEPNMLTIRQTNLDAIHHTLPTALKLRVQLANLQQKEFMSYYKSAGLVIEGIDDFATRPDSWALVYECSDGTVFLVDNLHMGLWILKDGKWKCLLADLRVDKTMGGARPHMPVLYMGNGFFAFSETVPGKVEEESKEGFPQALAVTFLLDSKTEDIKERSDSFIYDHTPPVRIPDAWLKRFPIREIKQEAP